MTATHTESSLEILEALDFEPEHECESGLHGKAPHHEGPAAYLIAAAGGCVKCGATFNAKWAICKKAWDYAGVVGLACVTDGCTKRLARRDVWAIVAVL